MSNKHPDTANDGAFGPDRSRSTAGPDDEQLVFASDVEVFVEPGGVQLIFRQILPLPSTADDIDTPIPTGRLGSKVIARVMLPSLTAERLLRLLPGHLATQRELADDYARVTERDAAKPGNPPSESRDLEAVASDPLLSALAAARLDDEPFTEEERAAARAGWEAYARGESAPWEDVRRSLLDEADAAKNSTP